MDINFKGKYIMRKKIVYKRYCLVKLDFIIWYWVIVMWKVGIFRIIDELSCKGISNFLNLSFFEFKIIILFYEWVSLSLMILSYYIVSYE